VLSHAEGDLVLGIADLATDRVHLGAMAGQESTRFIPRATVNTIGLVSILFSAIANFWATGLMAVKAWCAN